MKKSLPNILVSGWALWLVYLIVRYFIERGWTAEQSLADHGTRFPITFDCPLIVAITIFLAWRLYEKPRTLIAAFFVLLCLDLLWKFWIAPIVMWTHLSMGGHTIGQAACKWWFYGTSSVRLTLNCLLPPVLVFVSLFYWPGFCRQKSDKIQRLKPQ